MLPNVPQQLCSAVAMELLSKFFVYYSEDFLSINTSNCCYSTCAQSRGDSVTDRQATLAKFKFNEGRKQSLTVF